MAKNSKLLKTNLKLQIKNIENEIYDLMDVYDFVFFEFDELNEKLDHLKSKLKKLVTSGENKKQKS